MALLPYLARPQGDRSVWWPINAGQTTGIQSPAKFLLYGGGSGGGKRLDVDTPIATPDGWSTMGALVAGNTVFADTGQPCLVTVAHPPVMGDSYAVVFDDGTEIIADAEHLWHTFTSRDRVNISKRTSEARAKRRASRASRALLNPTNRGSQANVSQMNRDRPYVYLDAPTGGIRTTLDILQTLRTGNARNAINHAVRVAQPLECPEVDLPLPPYTLGAWLGDGTHTDGGLTSIDLEVIEHIRADGFQVNKRAHPQSWGILAWKTLAAKHGLLSNKHIPAVYFRASKDQRVALLQGLMDTDGTCASDGQSSFCSIRKVLALGVFELACSLGLKPSIRQFETKLKGRSCGPGWLVAWTAPLPVFRLKRKLDRLRQATRGCQNWRYITAVTKVSDRVMRCITVDSPSGLYLAGRSMIPTHNTSYLIADGAQEVGNPRFRGLLLRKSFTEMNNIIDVMMELYRPLGGHPSDGGKMWRFPSGAQMRLGYLAADGDVEKYQGSPFSWLGIDEAGNQIERRVRSILPWLASTDPALRVRARMTANPGGVGADWLMRIFLRDRCPIHFSEESVEPGAVYKSNKITWADGRPVDMTVSFIPALVGDNPLYGEEKIAMLRSQEGGISDKLLLGCWCELAGRYFNFLTPGMMAPYAESAGSWWNTHIISIDYGFGKSWAAAGLYYVSEPTLEHPQGRMFKIGEIAEQSMGSEDFAKHILSTFIDNSGGRRRQVAAVYCDPANDGHTGNGRSNMEIMGEVFAEREIPIMAAHKSRVDNFQNLFRMMKKGQVVITDACQATFKSLSSRMHDPAKSGDIKKIKGSPLDDLLDETAYAANTYFQGDAKPKEVRNAERLASYEAAGMDERSLSVYRLKMLMEQDDDEDGEPVRIARSALSRTIQR